MYEEVAMKNEENTKKPSETKYNQNSIKIFAEDEMCFCANINQTIILHLS